MADSAINLLSSSSDDEEDDGAQDEGGAQPLLQCPICECVGPDVRASADGLDAPPLLQQRAARRAACTLAHLMHHPPSPPHTIHTGLADTLEAAVVLYCCHRFCRGCLEAYLELKRGAAAAAAAGAPAARRPACPLCRVREGGVCTPSAA